MKNPSSKICAALILCAHIFCSSSPPAFALASAHHLYNASRRLCETAGAPFYGLLVQGPKNVKDAYVSEVREQEKPENNGLLRNKIFGIYRAPGEEIKGIITGVTDSVTSFGKACIEFISVFFGD
ncbi:MAG: hypothetical protein WC335_09015 [Candidatus Omnitrophota bacterium]|jgi:hypothetical protein